MLRVPLLILLLAITLALQVPKCIARKDYTISFTLIDGTPDPSTEAYICHDENSLYVRWNALDSEIIAPYHNCNDPLYNADAVQIFIATPNSYPTQYYELEVSPNGLLFFADINNPTGNCAALGSAFLSCSQANYGAEKTRKGWEAWLEISLSLIGRGETVTDFKINLFRIDVSSKSATKYLTWSPTFANPPCFHVPAAFQEITLV